MLNDRGLYRQVRVTHLMPPYIRLVLLQQRLANLWVSASVIDRRAEGAQRTGAEDEAALELGLGT